MKIESAYGLFPTWVVINDPYVGSAEVKYTYEPALDDIFANLSEAPQTITVHREFRPSPIDPHQTFFIRTESSIRIAKNEDIRIGHCVYAPWVVEEDRETLDTGSRKMLRSWYSPDLRMILKEAGEVPQAITANAVSQQ